MLILFFSSIKSRAYNCQISFIAIIKLMKSNNSTSDVFDLQAGRSDRKDFVKKHTKLNPYASTSNKEKKRKKNFVMMRHSQKVRTKGKRSFREKQVTHLLSVFDSD